MAVFENVYDEGKCFAHDLEGMATFLCDIVQVGEYGCDGCPATYLCGYGRNGFKELLKMPTSVLTEEDVWKKWKEDRPNRGI